MLNVRPAMLMEDTKAAARARLSGREEGVRPPPISTSPPTAVKPDGDRQEIKQEEQNLKHVTRAILHQHT